MAEGKIVEAEAHDFGHQKKPKTNKYAFACAILASMTSILLGYDIGVMSGAAIYIKRDLNISDVKIEVLLGIINIYSLLGIGMGYALMIAPVYTAEVAPAASRGFLTSFTEVSINVGILLGYVANLAFSKMALQVGWRMMLGVGAIPSVILAVGVLAMPESPRWLVMRGRLGEAATVLKKTSNSSEEAELRLAEIKLAAGIPADSTGDMVEIPKQKKGESVWKELFVSPTPAVLHVVIAAFGLQFFQQASGIDAVVLYSPHIFEKAGIKSDADQLMATIAVGVMKTFFILIATFLVDRVGRRPLLLTSVGGMIVSLLTLGVTLTVINHSQTKVMWAIALSIAMVLSYVATFSIGMGPIGWVYTSEIFPLRLRAQGTAMGVVVQRVTSGVISMTFLSLTKAITIGGAFFLFGVVAIVAWIFFYTMLPETQGKTLEDMQHSFGKFWRKKDDDTTKE